MPLPRALLVLVTLVPATAVAQAPYPTTPDWTSTDTQVSTGAALADLDRDGWLDLVVANGNDIYEQRLVVYYNQGDGTLPSTPDWQSADSAYNGHLDVADVNGDGWPDVAVAVLGTTSTIDPAAKLYLNSSGTLSSLPDWEATELANAFACAFGDVNNDGRPDLAVATGWAYSSRSFPDYVYVNSGGSLAATATWSSSASTILQGVHWVDADHDGWLDLVGVPNVAETMVYTNLGGSLETTPSWQTTDSSGQDAIMATSGDVDGDGYRDLFVTDNTQLGGSGRFRQYTGLAAGYFETTYSWSYLGNYGSALALADLDGDGDLDLATGGWWDSTRLFLNAGSGLSTTPGWTSALSSVIEKIVFGDVDRDDLETVLESHPAINGRLLLLSRQPIQTVVAVRLDGQAMTPDQYTFSREHGWVTTASAFGAEIEVEYTYCPTPDMAITNWDSSVGNYLYYNRLDPPLFSDGFESGDTTAWTQVVGGRGWRLKVQG